MRRWLLRLFLGLFAVLLVFMAVVYLTQFYPRRVPHPPLQLAQGTLAIQHARIYISPAQPPIDNGTILISSGLIIAVGQNLPIPPAATLIPCDHCVVTAGFWNAHVHLSQQRWSGAEWKKPSELDPYLADMFLSRGFTTVVDLGSNPADTLSLRRRIESAELDGPFIYTATSGLYPPHGVPYYLRETLPGWIVALMPQPDTPEEARRIVRENIQSGADLTKLFTGSWVQRGQVLPMPLNIAKAAVETTHLNGRLVFAHPSDLNGTRVAIDSGVDVLAHAANQTDGIDEPLLASAVRKNMSMIPTLKMFITTEKTPEAAMMPVYAEVRQFHALGGSLLFGTDVGYMTDYSTDGEFEALAKCDLDWEDVLAMLTTNPAARMGAADQKGTVTPGKLADLTILDADPADNLVNFARVRAVVRSGRIAWQR